MSSGHVFGFGCQPWRILARAPLRFLISLLECFFVIVCHSPCERFKFFVN